MDQAGWVQRQLGRDRAKTGQACLVSFLVIPMQNLRDKARELISIAEGEILKREKLILELRTELKKVKEELAAANSQKRAVRSEKCKGCIYKLTALKVLEKGKRGNEG